MVKIRCVWDNIHSNLDSNTLYKQVQKPPEMVHKVKLKVQHEQIKCAWWL